MKTVLTQHRYYLFNNSAKGSSDEDDEGIQSVCNQGNVIYLVVGVIIDSAFAKIVDSLVQDVIMPVAGKLFDGLDFTNYYLPLNNQGEHLSLIEAKKAGAVLAYSSFITILLNVLILAFIIFQMVCALNKAKRKEPEATAKQVPPPEDTLLLREIRDALKNNSRT